MIGNSAGGAAHACGGAPARGGADELWPYACDTADKRFLPKQFDLQINMTFADRFVALFEENIDIAVRRLIPPRWACAIWQ